MQTGLPLLVGGQYVFEKQKHEASENAAAPLCLVFVAAEARWYITMGHGDESVGKNGAVGRVWSDLTASYPSYFRTRSNTAVTSPAGDGNTASIHLLY